MVLWTLDFDKLIMLVIISRVTTERIQTEYIASKLVEEKWNKKSSLV